MEEWILRGGIVCDGTARPPARADILVKEGRIAAIAPHLPDTLPGFQADGCLVTPGFVDQHRHCDLAPFRDAAFGRLELAQGITSTVVGNCGLSAAPLDPNQDHDFFAYMAPVLGPVPAARPAPAMPLMPRRLPGGRCRCISAFWPGWALYDTRSRAFPPPRSPRGSLPGACSLWKRRWTPEPAGFHLA